MSLIESLKGAYFSLEDKWYGFVDSVSDKVPAFGNLVDSLEEKKIPSFPVAILILLLILLFVLFVIGGANSSILGITVTDPSGQAIGGATVEALLDGEKVADAITKTDGKAALQLANGTYTIRVQNAGQNPVVREIILNGNVDEEFTLTLEDATISKAVYLKTASGALVSGTGALVYKCASDSEEKTANYSNGQFTAQVKESCTDVEVVSIQNFRLIAPRASFLGNSAVTVEQEVQQTGTVIVNLSVEGATGGVAGLRVKLIPIDGTTPIENISSVTGTVQFANVPVKKYYVYVNSTDGNYAEYDGSKLGETKDVTLNATTTFSVTITKAVKATIKVNVKDVSTNNPISGAEVKLTSMTNQNDVRKKLTGATGQVTFDVADASTFVLTVDHPSYVVGETKPATAGDTIDMLLTKVDESNSNSLLVKVVDGKKNAISNARVILKKIDPIEPVVGEKTTGAEGTVEFFNLELGKSYMATVSKENFGSINSTSIQIVPRTQKVLEVIFDIAEGTIDLKVMDSEKNPISGVSVKAMNAFTGQQEGSIALTSSSGIAEFKIRGDKKVYFVIESTGYSKYFTSAIYPVGNAVTNKDVILTKTSAQLTTTIVGIYSGDAEVKASSDASSVGQGTYTVRAIVQVPKGIFSEAGLHLRTGKETQNVTNLMEEDGLYIGDVRTFGRLAKGTTYTPPQGSEKDLKQLTTSNAKWINSVWKNPQEGTYEVEADITVTETNPNAPLNIFYRAWAKGSSVLRDPVMATPASNELYSSAKKRVLLAGAGNLCTGSFCKAYAVEALSGSEAGKKKYISGSFEAKKGIQYLLTADLTNYSGRALIGSSLTVEGKSIDVNAVSINGAEQTDKVINLGNIGIDAPLQVRVLFTPAISGTAGIRFSINSSTRNELDETVTVNVKANKKFSLDVTPKIILPYINNTMFFEAKDGNNSLSGVLITIKSGRDVLATVETSGEGLAKYELTEPSTGDEITITAAKEGYDTVEIIKKVDSAVLTIIPPSITETIKIGVINAISESIVLQNNTAKSIKITDAKVSGELKNYVTVGFEDTIAGTVIEQGKDRNYSLSIKLTSAAQRLKEPKDITGTILINTTPDGTNQSFVNEIPLRIRLSMPGYLDNSKCLKVTPASVEFITSTIEQTKTVRISNTCSAEENKIALNNLEARLSEASKFGSVSVSGDGFIASALSDKTVKIADHLEAEAEKDLTIKFSPSAAISAGTQEVTITLIGKNILQDKSEEKAESTIKTKVTMSNLARCIEVVKPEGGVLLDMAPWNLGYGRLMMSDYSSQLSAYGANYGGFTNRSAPYGLNGMTMYGMGMGGGYAGGAGANAGSNMASYQQSSFTVKNNCSSDVDVQLDVDSRLTVSEQKFTIGKDEETTVTVQPGYVLGKYTIKVNAKAAGTDDAKKKVSDVPVIVRRLGDVDTDCITTNAKTISFNSFIYKAQKFTAFNSCYDTGVQLTRDNKMVTIECTSPKLAQSFNGQTYSGASPYTGYGSTSQYNYGQYPLSATALQGNGCPASDCSVVSGTRVINRTIDDGTTGSIEKVDFEIMPSTQYMAQSKLFGNNGATAGPFQTIGDFRQWATQSNDRLNITGDLHISYTNMYGSGECMTFPINITDIWRITETLDSAFNWGDPNARPKDCQRKGALNILDYWKYRGSSAGAIPDSAYNGSVYVFVAEPSALKIGPAPSQQSQYYPANNYFRDQQYYNGQTYNGSGSTYAGLLGQNYTNPSDRDDSALKNCGVLDGIEVLNQIKPEDAGGALIFVSETASGSLIKNTRGSNLEVAINRAGMTSDCVLINTPIYAKVSRANTFESQELVWNLTALIVKQGITISESEVATRCKVINNDDQSICIDKLRQFLNGRGINPQSVPQAQVQATPGKPQQVQAQTPLVNGTTVDTAAVNRAVTEFLAANPTCARYITNTSAIDILNQQLPSATQCQANINDYGVNKIKTLQLASMAKSDVVDCTKYFCNGDMLQSFLLNRFNEIREIVKTNKDKLTLADNDLNTLYLEAPTQEIANCISQPLNFYEGADKELILVPYTITNPPLTTQKKESITSMQSPLADMVEVLNGIDAKDKNSILIEVKSNDAYAKEFTNMGLVKVKDNHYMSLASFKSLLEGVQTKENDACAVTGKNCTVPVCDRMVDLNIQAFAWMANNNVKLVKGVSYTPDLENGLPVLLTNAADIDAVYKANPILAQIHNLAAFKTMYLTSIIQPNRKPVPEMFTTDAVLIKDFTLDFNTPQIEVGQYSVELSYYYPTDDVKAYVYVGGREEIKDAPKAQNNIMLARGFNFVYATVDQIMDNTLTGAIMVPDASGILFYNRVPLLFNATTTGYENGIYYFMNNLPGKANLMNWYDAKGSLISADARTEGGYGVKVPTSPTPQTMKAVFYAPLGGALIFVGGSQGYSVNTTNPTGVITLNSIASIGPLKGPNSIGTIQATASGTQTAITPDNILAQLKNGNACIADNTVNWNEKKIIQAN